MCIKHGFKRQINGDNLDISFFRCRNSAIFM